MRCQFHQWPLEGLKQKLIQNYFQRDKETCRKLKIVWTHKQAGK